MKRLALFGFLTIFLFQINLQAQDAKIKSGIIYYFTKYVEWPASKSSGDFIICVVGNADIKPYLDVLAKAKTVGTRKIVVKTVNSPSEAKSANIIFLPKAKNSLFGTAVSIAKQYSCLLVTETDGYGRKGTGINLVTINGKPSFEINESATSACKLKVSSKLTALGTVL